MRNQWIPWLRTQYPNALTIDTHGNVNPRCSEPSGTTCPGPTIGPLVTSRFFDQPEPTLFTEGGDNVQILYLRDEHGTCYKTTSATHVVWTLTAEQFDFADALSRLTTGQPLVVHQLAQVDVAKWGNVVPAGATQ
jgi:hypothetical protein